MTSNAGFRLRFRSIQVETPNPTKIAKQPNITKKPPTFRSSVVSMGMPARMVKSANPPQKTSCHNPGRGGVKFRWILLGHTRRAITLMSANYHFLPFALQGQHLNVRQVLMGTIQSGNGRNVSDFHRSSPAGRIDCLRPEPVALYRLSERLVMAEAYDHPLAKSKIVVNRLADGPYSDAILCLPHSAQRGRWRALRLCAERGRLVGASARQ